MFLSWYSREKRRQKLGETLKTGFGDRDVTQVIIGGLVKRGLSLSEYTGKE